MTRSEELRQELTDKLAIAIANYERYGGDELHSQHVLLDWITAQRLHTLLTEPVKWLIRPDVEIPPTFPELSISNVLAPHLPQN